MSIKRIMLLASMALAAIAFAAPAAQAEVMLTDEEGVPLAYGADVTATSTNFETVTGVGALKCKLVTLHFEVKANGETDHVMLDPVGEATFNGCSLGGEAVMYTDGAVLTPLTIDTWGTGYVGVDYVAHIKGTVCRYSGVVHAEGAGSGQAELNFGPSLLAGAGLCFFPVAQFFADFTLETESEEPVLLDYVETE